jgi:tetratricopeptide (TPR) repeat protein
MKSHKRPISENTFLNLAGIVLFTVLTPSIAAENSLVIRGEQIPASDAMALPPVCRLIVIDQPGSHNGAGDRALAQYAPLFEQPKYHMAKNNPHLHHYCWALLIRPSYLRARDKTRRQYLYKMMIGDINYVLTNSNRTWQYFHILLLEQAQLMMLEQDYAGSLGKANEALRYKPKFDRAYALISDVYRRMGDNEKAKEAIREGLQENPKSSLLRARLKRLGEKAYPSDKK